MKFFYQPFELRHCNAKVRILVLRFGNIDFMFQTPSVALAIYNFFV